MKKIIAFFAGLFALVASIACLVACSSCGNKDGGNLEFKLSSDETYYTVAGIGDFTGVNLVIPSEYEGLPVQTIGAGAFKGNTKLLSVTIPESVTSVSASAFNSCYNLVEIYNLTDLNFTTGSTGHGYVAYYAKVVHTSKDAQSIISKSDDFYFVNANDVVTLVGYSGNQSKLTLPKNFNGKDYTVSRNVFENDKNITELVIEEGVTSIGISAFAGCENLMRVTVSNTVASISSKAFENCPKLVEVYNFSRNNIAIGGTSFGEVALNALAVHTQSTDKSILDIASNGVVMLDSEGGKVLFSYIGKDKELTLPSTYQYDIGANAFASNKTLEKVIIPSCVNVINKEAFVGCSSLKSINVPKSVNTIGARAFLGCTSLESVTFEDTQGWTYSSSKSLDVSDAKENAKKLSKGTFTGNYLYKGKN